MAAVPPVCDFGWKGVDAILPGVDGNAHQISDHIGPGGHVVAFQAVATDLLAAEEADQLFDVMGVVPSSADPRVIDDAIARSGLEVVDTVDLSTEWGEWSQEQDGGPARALLHLSRLLRAPARYRAELGETAYDVAVAECRWQVFQMAGKLAGRIDVLRRPTRR